MHEVNMFVFNINRTEVEEVQRASVVQILARLRSVKADHVRYYLQTIYINYAPNAPPSSAQLECQLKPPSIDSSEGPSPCMLNL
jgi:hypothetical protein